MFRWHSSHCKLHQLDDRSTSCRTQVGNHSVQQKHRSVVLLLCSASTYPWLDMYFKHIEKKTELIWGRAGAAKGGREEDMCFSAGRLCWTSLCKRKKGHCSFITWAGIHVSTYGNLNVSVQHKHNPNMTRCEWQLYTWTVGGYTCGCSKDTSTKTVFSLCAQIKRGLLTWDYFWLFCSDHNWAADKKEML